MNRTSDATTVAVPATSPAPAGTVTTPLPPVRPVAGRDPAGHLATGWEPHRPVQDGLVRRFVHAYASSFAAVVQAHGGRVVQRDGYVVHDLGRPAATYGGVSLLAPLPHGEHRRVLAAIEADLVPGGTGDVLLWSAWPTPDLSADGWRLQGHPPLLLRPTGEAEPPPPAWLRIERVSDRRRLADWERVAVEGYPFTDVQPWRPGVLAAPALLDDPRFHAWVGYDGDEPVTIGTSYVAHGVHVFALGVTRPSHRGRGAWEAMARRRLGTFPRLPVMSLFSDFSRGPAERLGFLPLSRWTLWGRARR
ncbi:hypothetical protein [Egicoccus sp. AB-alg2]|uniref:hypothetical protein n=1 Tax=Egicoccus sp. AB-alg2 TaxID=3242693 RepID=UPI00359CF972